MNISTDTVDGRAERRNALRVPDRANMRRWITANVSAAKANCTSGAFLCAVEWRRIIPQAAMPMTRIKGESHHTVRDTTSQPPSAGADEADQVGKNR